MSERSEREIRESIETTRARMGETIEQIGDRVNPDRVKAELKARARDQIHEARDNVKRKARNTMRDVEHGVSDTGRSIWATIRDNPVPAGMVGVGLAWLIANRSDADRGRDREHGTYSTGPAVPYRPGYAGEVGGSADAGGAQFRVDGESNGPGGIRDRASTVLHEAGDRLGGAQERVGEVVQDTRDRVGEAVHDARERVGEAMHDTRERVGEAMHDTRERVGEVMHDTRERVGHAMHDTQERMSDWAHEAKYRARRAEHRVEASMRENPVAAGAMALAFGVAAGLMIPESEREHEVMGRTRDRVLDRAQDAVRRSAGKMHDAASDTAAETARHVVDEVWPGGDDRPSEGFSEPRR